MCELCRGEDPRTPDQQERDRILYLAQFGAVGLLREFDRRQQEALMDAPATCLSCNAMPSVPGTRLCADCRSEAAQALGISPRPSLLFTCPSCGDPTPNAGYCQACLELGEDQFVKVLNARGLILGAVGLETT